jgi:hypothetical protein
MNGVDGLVLLILAIADFCLLVHLRRRHARHVRQERVITSMQTAVRRELLTDSSPKPRWMRRAS